MKKKEMLVVGRGVIGSTVAAQALLDGWQVRFLTSPTKPVAGLNGVGILERQGGTVNVLRENGSERFSTVAWENASFARFRNWVGEKRPWVNFMPVIYHRDSPTEDAFEDPFPGMEPRLLRSDEVTPSYSVGFQFNGFVIDLRGYFDFLQEIIEAHHNFVGAEAGEIDSPNDIDHPLSVITCGMGQRKWDPTIFPGMGETLVVEAPNVRRDRVVGGIRADYSGNVVPIPGTESRVVVGASKRDHLNSELPHEPWHDRILATGIQVVPELAGAKVVEQRSCDRPKREGGVLVHVTQTPGRKQVVAGGFGGMGWTLSWGAASCIISELN